MPNVSSNLTVLLGLSAIAGSAASALHALYTPAILQLCPLI